MRNIRPALVRLNFWEWNISKFQIKEMDIERIVDVVQTENDRQSVIIKMLGKDFF
jgi:hypothetical protein